MLCWNQKSTTPKGRRLYFPRQWRHRQTASNPLTSPVSLACNWEFRHQCSPTVSSGDPQVFTLQTLVCGLQAHMRVRTDTHRHTHPHFHTSETYKPLWIYKIKHEPNSFLTHWSLKQWHVDMNIVITPAQAAFSCPAWGHGSFTSFHLILTRWWWKVTDTWL